MKYKVGDKVRYDGGEWWFYGTVSAVFEHSISPCYRLNVERMEKKIGRFSIIQFEFDLEAYEEAGSDKDKRKRELPEIEDLKKRDVPDLGALFEMPEKKQKKELKQKAKQKKVEKPKIEEIKPRIRKTSDAWEKNFELFRNGEKSNVISTWIASNRKQYKDGILTDDKLEKLVEIQFPFEVAPKVKKADSWDRQLEEWKNGNRKASKIQYWKHRSIKRYTEGKLSADRIAKLKEVGILK